MGNHFEDIIYEVRDHIVKITINRPKKLNAMTPKTEKELRTAFQQVQDDDNARVLILTGAGQRGFCSGEDISELIHLEANKPLPQPAELVRTPTPSAGTPRALFDVLEKPVIAAIKGQYS